MKLKIYTGVAIGGGIGSILRLWISTLLQVNSGFPYGTLTVNLIGCFSLSLLYQLFAKHPPNPVMQKAVTTGIVGSFTTFSAFILETGQLFQQEISASVGYLTITLCGGAFMTFLGYKIGGKLI